MIYSDFVLVSKNEKIQKRLKSIGDEFTMHYSFFDDADSLFESEKIANNAKCVVVDCIDEKPQNIAGLVQSVKYVSNNAFIAVITGSRIDSSFMDIIMKSGASMIIIDNDFFESSRIEFVISQIVRSSYIPVKVLELLPESYMECPLYYLMPANRKFLKISNPGMKINKVLIQKFASANELYIHRTDIDKWVEYVKTFYSDNETLSFRLGRAQYLKLHQGFLELALMITDQSSTSSFFNGSKQFEQVLSFISDLSKTLDSMTDPWTFINNSSIGDFGSVERSPAIAAYANTLAAKFKSDKVDDIIIAALLADVGQLLLTPSTTKRSELDNLTYLPLKRSKNIKSIQFIA